MRFRGLAVVLLVGFLGQAAVPSANAGGSTAVPGAPPSVSAQAGDHEAVVSWSVPPDNGSPITGYQVRYSAGMVNDPALRTWSSPISAPSSASSLAVTGLSNGTYYVFQVVATNVNGASPASQGGGVVPSGLPLAPSAVWAVPYNRYAAVFWNAADANGSDITGYRVTATPGGISITTTGPATYATIPGLTNGTRYTIAVHAINANGASLTTAQTMVTPTVSTRIALSGAHPYFMGGRRYYPIRVYVKTDGTLPGYVTSAPPGYVTLTVSGPPGVAKTYRVLASNTTGVVLHIALTGRQGILSIKAAYPGSPAYRAAPAYTFDPTILRS